MIRKSFKIIAVLLAVCTVLTGTIAVSALGEGVQQPFTGYTYWNDVSSSRKAVYSRPMYEVSAVLDADALGLSAPFETVNDVCTDAENRIYVLDSKSRIVMLDSSYRLLGEIGPLTDTSGAAVQYDGAKSLYVHSDGTIFLCDTENARVLRIDSAGNILDTYLLPDSPLIPDDFQYRPLRAVMDSHGYLYVLSDGSYYGALLYAPDRSFTGFYGANKVTIGIAGTLQNIMDRIFPNNAKKSASVRTLPYCFVDIVIDAEDFVYTATGKTTTYDLAGQIKKLNPGSGSNILGSETVNFVDDDFNNTYKNGGDGSVTEQDIVGISVDENGFIYCLEAQFGRIYLYDSECRMLSAFGGGMDAGVQDGTFMAASCIALNGSDVIVGDSVKNTLTVFTATDFGLRAMGLIDLTLDGEYLLAKAGWEEILKEDRNFQPAYGGLARAYLTEGNYSEAMAMAKEGYDRETYQLAFELQRKEFIAGHFWLIFLSILLLIGAAAAFLIVSMRKKVTVIRSGQLHLMLMTPIHPVNSFGDIKDKGRGSIPLCILLTALFYVTAVIQVLCGGFLFTQYDPADFNSVWVFVRSVGLVVFWIISNWMICTLMQGKGKLREICIVTCYSLTPIIVERLLRLLLTNILLPTEAIFLNGLDTIAVLYTLLLIIIGLIRIHDFGLGQLIGTSILTIACVAALVFLIVLVGMLVQQLGAFIATVALELIS